jgi:hypothetical protein
VAAPKLFALHRDVQVLGCDCDGCAGLADSEYIAETRASLNAALPPEIDTPSPHPEHRHVQGEVVEVRYASGVPYGIHACEICGQKIERRTSRGWAHPSTG